MALLRTKRILDRRTRQTVTEAGWEDAELEAALLVHGVVVDRERNQEAVEVSDDGEVARLILPISQVVAFGEGERVLRRQHVIGREGCDHGVDLADVSRADEIAE